MSDTSDLLEDDGAEVVQAMSVSGTSDILEDDIAEATEAVPAMSVSGTSGLLEDDVAEVVRIGAAFDDFQSFDKAFKDYQAATFQLFVVKRSKSVVVANRGIDPCNALKQELAYANVTFQCKHGGMPRKEGTGSRPNQRTAKVDCTAYVKCKSSKEMQKLVVVDVCLQHTGHEVSESVCRHYPQNRRLTTEEEQLVQEPVTELQVNPSLLRNFLQSKTGKPLTAKDIENVVARLKGNKKPDIEQLGEEIKELFRQDPTAAVTLGTNNSNEMELLLIQTSMMAEFYKKFPEGVEKTKCVIVDKDFKEIRAIRNNFSSDAVVQLCEFHVKKALKRAVTSSKDDADKDRLNSLLVKMIHAPNEEAYDVLKAELDQTASEGFKAYFEKHWHNMQDMWVRYRCDQHFNLGNNTTNRVECHNSKLKAVLKVSDKIQVALKSMLKLHSIKIVESETCMPSMPAHHSLPTRATLTSFNSALHF
ncbi:uncharacterized protein ISCGN_029563 [Ixodes scapularis]